MSELDKVINTKLAIELVKKLWPTMAMPLGAILIVYGCAFGWNVWIGSKINGIISFWFWFISALFLIGFSIYGFFIDIRAYVKTKYYDQAS
jgi:hypothetical protein